MPIRWKLTRIVRLAAGWWITTLNLPSSTSTSWCSPPWPPWPCPSRRARAWLMRVLVRRAWSVRVCSSATPWHWPSLHVGRAGNQKPGKQALGQNDQGHERADENRLDHGRTPRTGPPWPIHRRTVDQVKHRLFYVAPAGPVAGQPGRACSETTAAGSAARRTTAGPSK